MKDNEDWNWPQATTIMFFLACVTAVVIAVIVR